MVRLFVGIGKKIVELEDEIRNTHLELELSINEKHDLSLLLSTFKHYLWELERD